MSTLPECDYCDNTEGVTKIKGELVCPECIDKVGKDDVNESSISIDTSASPIPVNDVLRQSRQIDSNVTVRTDLFNAATVAIVALKKAIDDDVNITNKPFALASELQTRFLKHKQVIFELNQQVVEEANKQKAIQVYLNGLANTLRAEEREKLKIADINYQPRALKMPVSPKNIKASNKKIDKAALRVAAKELGIPEFSLRMICIQKSLSLEQVVMMVRKNLNDAKAKSTVAEPSRIESNPPVESIPSIPSNTTNESVNSSFIVTDEETVDMTNNDGE